MEPNGGFYVQAFYKGGMNSFEIIPEKGHYNVVYNGEVIAQIQFNDQWKQISGEPLPKDTLTSILQEIQGKQKH